MFCITSEIEGEVGAVKSIQTPSNILHYWLFQCGTSDLVLCVCWFLVSVSVLCSPSVCLDDILLGLGS